MELPNLADDTVATGADDAEYPSLWDGLAFMFAPVTETNNGDENDFKSFQDLSIYHEPCTEGVTGIDWVMTDEGVVLQNDGVGRITFGSDPAFRSTITDQISIFSRLQLTADAVAAASRIVSKLNGTGSDDFNLNMNFFDGNNRVFMRIRNTSDSVVQTNSGSDAGLNVWFNALGTYDGANIRTYLNNVLQDTEPQTGNIQDATSAFCVSGHGGSTIRSLPGYIAIVCVWSRVLEDSERDLLQSEPYAPLMKRARVLEPAAPAGGTLFTLATVGAGR